MNQVSYLAGTVTLTRTFKVGDLLCSKANFQRGVLLCFTATDSDVSAYSGGGNEYYRFEISNLIAKRANIDNT